jgi:hypothetical protein
VSENNSVRAIDAYVNTLDISLVSTQRVTVIKLMVTDFSIHPSTSSGRTEKSLVRSFPRAAWECSVNAPRCRPQRGLYEFPRSAWELDKKYFS